VTIQPRQSPISEQVVQETPSDKLEPTSESSEPWQIIERMDDLKDAHFGAFLNESFGAIGCGNQAHFSYTTDGGQTWTTSDTTTG